MIKTAGRNPIKYPPVGPAKRPRPPAPPAKTGRPSAGILAMDAKIIVFDETFSNLDYTGFKQVLTQIIALHEKGHTILIATHDIEKVIDYADRLIVLQDGKIVRDGPPEETVAGIEMFGVREPGIPGRGPGRESWQN